MVKQQSALLCCFSTNFRSLKLVLIQLHSNFTSGIATRYSILENIKYLHFKILWYINVIKR